MDRRTALGGAALRVLARDGSRGLTHRAVDDEAELPRGSVNYYVKTRDELVGLALEELFRHDYLAASGGRPSRAGLAGDVLALVTALTTPEASRLQVARFELLLEARRRPGLASELSRQRREFVSLTERALRRSGCGSPRAHAEPLVTFVDGLVTRQVLVPDPLPRAALQRAIKRQLEGC